MANLAIKIVLFGFILNMVVFILPYVVTGLPQDVKSLLTDTRLELDSGTQSVIAGFEGNVTVTSQFESGYTVMYRLLDSLIIGKVKMLMDSLNRLLFGVLNVICNILLYFSPKVDAWAYNTFVETLRLSLHGLFSLLYGITAFSLISGKQVT